MLVTSSQNSRQLQSQLQLSPQLQRCTLAPPILKKQAICPQQVGVGAGWQSQDDTMGLLNKSWAAQVMDVWLQDTDQSAGQGRKL